jgi:hypothetical protein
MSDEEITYATDELLTACLAHLDNLLVQSNNQQQLSQAGTMKGEVLRLQIRLAQRRIKGIGFDDNERQLLERFVPVLRNSLPPLP